MKLPGHQLFSALIEAQLILILLRIHSGFSLLGLS